MYLFGRLSFSIVDLLSCLSKENCIVCIVFECLHDLLAAFKSSPVFGDHWAMTTLILLWSAAVLASWTSGEPDERNQEGTHYLIEVSDQGERAHCVDIEGNRRDKGEVWKEGCNTCVCSMFSLTHGGVGECTRTDGCGDPKQCVDIRGNLREPGEKWKNPGDCNTCTCGLAVPGTASCTEMGCQDDSVPAPDWPRQVQKEQEQVGWGKWLRLAPLIKKTTRRKKSGQNLQNWSAEIYCCKIWLRTVK